MAQAAAFADEAATRALLLDSGTAEAVTVNQRALIDKILARYAAEFTVFRELVQNADDAGAEACELRFTSQNHGSKPETSTDILHPSPPDLKATLTSWTFRNNGKPFGGDDWNRLRRIAEGNPDPDRIGAFGVGFYSLFSISEEPLVRSGSEVMGFFWKGDSLFTRRAKTPEPENPSSQAPWTTFHMPLREPAPFPESFLDLSRFLATSLTFTANVKRLSLYLDDRPLCRLKKTLEPARAITMPSHLNATSPRKMLRATGVDSVAMRIDVEALQHVLDQARKPKTAAVNLTSAFTKAGGGGIASMLANAFGRSKDKEVKINPPHLTHAEDSSETKASKALSVVSSSVHVRIATATASVSVDRAFEREIERSTKKPPPKFTKLQVIVQNKDEADASREIDHEQGLAEIFKGVMPSIGSQGHIFIGFKTSQTTSFAGHLAARFIPTVERESIDFIDRYCAQWNGELLAMGGYITRAVYEAEMSEISKSWSQEIGTARPKDGDETVKKLLDRALHLMRFFTFRPSTPSPRVYSTLETAFFACARQPTLTLASSRGIKHSALIRFPNAVLTDFIKDLAVIPPSHVESAADFISQVKSRGLVREISMDDVFSELSARTLSVDEMIACLKWWITVANHPSYEPSLLRQLLGSAILKISNRSGSEGHLESVQQLGSVKSFLNPQRVPTDVPLPPSCLAYEVSKALPSHDMQSVFGWTELTVASWVSYIAGLSRVKDVEIERNIQLSPIFAEKILAIIARAWGSLPAAQIEEISSTLANIPCIPTRMGMQKPQDAYFASVSLFEDLPIVSLPTQQVRGNLEKFLATLGVRRHVDLQMIFDRLIAAGDWDVTQLVTYLASNKDTLSSLEKERLTKTAIFPKAGEVGPLGKDGKPRTLRYRASQLYEPTEQLRSLKLPLLDWPGKNWRQNSEEAKFVYELGLRRNPSLEEVLTLASSSNEDEAVRSKAFAFLLEKYSSLYKTNYTLKVASNFAFVPGEVAGRRALFKPSEIFTNKEARVLGFPIVSAEVAAVDVTKLGLRANPSSAQIVSRLVNEPEKDLSKARTTFEYLTGINELSSADFKLLSTAAIIPIEKQTKVNGVTSQEKVTLARPLECFFGKDGVNKQLSEVLAEVFTFIDFGQRASTFLRACGVTDEPSIEEIAVQLVRDPQRFFRLAGIDGYLSILRQIATNWQRMSQSLRGEMRRSSFALASKRVTIAANAASLDVDNDDDDAEEQGVLVNDLRRPSDIVIVDDASSHMLFASVVFAVPHEDLIEGMMAELGSKRLSTLIEERYITAGRVLFDTQQCAEIKATILERTPLFIFEKRQMSKSEIRHDAEWLKKHLQVAQVDGRGLRLTRHLHYGKVDVSNEQRCSAMASTSSERGRSGELVLYVAANSDVDWFEIASALSKHLLLRQRLQEVLLYMTLLSTSLRNLKRRGFHVDKILSQRKADREAAEHLLREERARAELEESQRPNEGQIRQWVQDMLAVFPDADPLHVERLLRDAKTDHVVTATNKMLEQSYPRVPPPKPQSTNSSAALAVAGKNNVDPDVGISSSERQGASGGLLSSWRNKLRGSSEAASVDGIPGGWQPGQTKYKFPESLANSAGSGQVADSIAGSLSATSTTSESTARNPNAGVTPSANIRRKVLSAIDASRGNAPSSFGSIQSAEHQTRVKEAQSTYCDTTGVAMNLRLAGQVSGMDVYVSPELDPTTTLANNGEAMKNFIDLIIKPIVGVFNLDVRSVHVFVDVSGPSIAFNRAGQLFLNFRYHLVWFDEEVRQGRLSNALISTYHSMAHELAHNLVAQHDSEHEFWFSSICEQYFVSFSTLVVKAESRASEALANTRPNDHDLIELQ